MSKISERRERTANTRIDPKAYLAEAPVQKKEYIYKKALIALLAIVAIAACVLLMINAVIDAQAKKFVNAPEHSTAVATTPATGLYYENTAELLENAPKFRAAYQAVIDNMARPEVVNAKYDENVYNFVATINSDRNATSGNLTIVMLLSFNKTEDKVTYVYIHKSTLAYIPTVGVGPLYDAYAYGGAALLTRAVEENYGIKVDGYVDFPLDSFVTACTDIGGITIDETEYTTKDEIYDYVDKAEDREKAVYNVVSELAKGTLDQKLFGASKVALKIVESAKANIDRDDIGELLYMGVKIFKKDAQVGMLGYDTLIHAYTPNFSIQGNNIFDYVTEITNIQNMLYPAPAAE